MSTRTLTYLLALASLAASVVLLVLMQYETHAQRLGYAIMAAAAIVFGVATIVANLPSKQKRSKVQPQLTEHASP